MNWRVNILILLALVGGFAVLFAIVTRPIAAPHHEIYVNGTVLTMDSDNAIAEAVSVRDGIIEAVGGSEAMLARATDDTQVVDLRGRTLIPGFVDAHGHFPGSGQTVFSVDLNSPPIGDVADIDQLLARLSDFALKRADGWWGTAMTTRCCGKSAILPAMIWIGSVGTGPWRWCMCQAISR
jgi:imidazolonepropionase-like amidohydrolase